MDKPIRIHFIDAYGSCCLECDDYTYDDFMEALRADPWASDIWVERYDEETGWTA